MKKLRNEFKAGLFIIVCLLLFGASIFVMGKERQLFARQLEYGTKFKDVKGLAEGAPVRLGGITIGRVASITFPENQESLDIEVRLLVNDKFTARVRADSTVTIETQGLLGDRFLNISTGSSREPAPQGAFLRSRDSGNMDDMVDEVRSIVSTTSGIVKNVDEIISRVKSDGLESLVEASKSVARITKDIETGDGVAHALVYSKPLKEEVLSTVRSVSAIVREAETGKGVLHALVYGDEGEALLRSVGTMATSFSETAALVEGIVREVQNGKGMLHALIYAETPKGSETLIQDLGETVLSLRKAADALANGTGTLGALLVDPSLYDNLMEVTDDAKRSFLLRQALKKSVGK